MKNILLSLLMILFFYSQMKVNELKANNLNGKKGSIYYKVCKIDSVNTYYLIYAERNDSIFKIVSKKEEVINPDKIKIGSCYEFALYSLRNSLVIGGVKIAPVNYLDAPWFFVDESTAICIESNCVGDLFFANNLKGLSLINKDRSAREQGTPSFKEEKGRYLESYNDVENIDTSFVNGKDILHVKVKYYCLRNSVLRIPRIYNFAEKRKKDFVTHEFASDVLITNNKDTLFNKVVLSNWFYPIIGTQLKRYGILFSPNISKFNRIKGEVVLQYSISIPITDIGVGVYLVVDKYGNYKVLKKYE